MSALLEIQSAAVPCGTPSHLFTVPTDDATGLWFASRVQEDEQKRVRSVLAAIGEIWNVRKTEKVNPACQRLAFSLERNWRSLRRDYYAYTAHGVRKGTTFYPAGDWRTVLNFSKVKTDKISLPFAFLEFWRELGELNQRKWKPAYDELLNIVRTHYGFAHEANQAPKHYIKFPGFEQWPVIDPTLGHPAGMSYSNLMNHCSDRYDVAAVRQGRAKASEHRLPVLKSRVGVPFGSVLIFDDHDFNQKVLFQKRAMRPMGFGCVEYLSSCMVKLGLKPMLWDAEEEQKRVLTEREFLWFFLAVISDVGFNPDGCRFDLENAKATIREPWLSRLRAVLGPKFVFNFGCRPANHTRAIAGQFEGQGKGNFRTKALLESFWNPLDNQTAHSAGQIGTNAGSSHSTKPDQLYGAEKYTQQIIRAAEANDVALDRLQFPFDLFPNWAGQAHAAVNRINAATDHALEGWEACRFVRLLWRESETSGLWLTQNEFEALPEMTRAIVRQRLDANPKLVQKEVFSRVQVANSLRGGLKKFPVHHWPEILGREFALVNSRSGSILHEVGKQQAGLFSFDCEAIDADTIHFYARDPRGYLKNGDRYVCFLNPFLPQQLVVCDEALRVVAICPRYEKTVDDATLKKNLGEQHSYEAAAEVRLNLRHSDAARAKRARKAHNDAALAADSEIVEAGETTDCTADILARAEAGD